MKQVVVTVEKLGRSEDIGKAGLLPAKEGKSVMSSQWHKSYNTFDIEPKERRTL